MKTKVSLTINAKSYDIDLDDEFAQFLIDCMKNDFDFEGNNDLKVLLQGYVRRSYALFEQEKQINSLIEKFQKLAE